MVKIRWDDFTTYTRQRSFEVPVSEATELRRELSEANSEGLAVWIRERWEELNPTAIGWILRNPFLTISLPPLLNHLLLINFHFFLILNYFGGFCNFIKSVIIAPIKI